MTGRKVIGLLSFKIVMFLIFPSQSQGRTTVFQFDCGAPSSPVKQGWIQVTYETVYTPERGYGWLCIATSSFDRNQIFVPDWLKPSVPKIPAPDAMLRDDVFDKFDKDELTFRVDVPDGDLLACRLSR